MLAFMSLISSPLKAVSQKLDWDSPVKKEEVLEAEKELIISEETAEEESKGS